MSKNFKINLGSGNLGSKKKKDKNLEEYILEENALGKEFLEKIRVKEKGDSSEEVIYGLYNNSNSSLWVRINDFLIDNSRVKLKDKSYFFHMLAVMVDAGIPLVPAIKSLANRTKNKRFQRVLNTVAYHCERGVNFADAMNRFEDVFDDAEIGIVRSAEATGKMHVLLFRLSDQLDKRYDLYLRLWTASVYPMAVFAILVLVVVGMLAWVLPTLLNLLLESGVPFENLPKATLVLIFLKNVLIDYWWLVLIVILGLFSVFHIYKNTYYGGIKIDYMKLNIPIVGNLLKKIFVLRFISLLGILIDSGLPVIDSLKISGNSLKNHIYRLKVQEVINNVKIGQRISDILKKSPFLFSPEIVDMINIGEKSASLGRVSEKIGDEYTREIDNNLKQLTSIFEPIMILIVGVFVGILALAIMVPIFNLSNIAGL